MQSEKQIRTGIGQSIRFLITKVISKKQLGYVLPLAILVSLTSCSTNQPVPPGKSESFGVYERGVPGGMAATNIEMHARVTEIDHFNRQMTLLDNDGKSHTIAVAPVIALFDEIQVDDILQVSIAVQLIVFINDENYTSMDGATAVMALGAQSGGLVAEAREVIGTVVEINQEQETVTLQFINGEKRTFPVRDDIDLSKHKVGEEVVFHITEMLAVNIEKL